MPTAIYFAFGTRKVHSSSILSLRILITETYQDVFQAWMFWRKGRGDHPSQISSNATIGSGRSHPRVIEVHLRPEFEDGVTFAPKTDRVQVLEGIRHET